MAQKDTNPYPYSDSNKRYLTYDRYMKLRFGGKTAKLALDAGCTCPNLDGTKGRGGCLYCKNGSRSAVGVSLAEQMANGEAVACRKWKPVGFIPYFQANTNTYGDLSRLRRAFLAAAEREGTVMVDVATRGDCLGDDALAVLEELAHRIPVTVELGLQTSDDGTAERIHRCHTFGEFREGYTRLRELADRINGAYPAEVREGLPMNRFLIGVHLINGLPGEGEAEMLRTVEDTAALRPDLVKIHLLHVLRGTGLGDLYEAGAYTPMEREDYVRITCDQLERLPPETVIGRVTGDGMAEDLLAPLWSRRKTEVSNEIDKELYRRGSWQGMRFRK